MHPLMPTNMTSTQNHGLWKGTSLPRVLIPRTSKFIFDMTLETVPKVSMPITATHFPSIFARRGEASSGGKHNRESVCEPLLRAVLLSCAEVGRYLFPSLSGVTICDVSFPCLRISPSPSRFRKSWSSLIHKEASARASIAHSSEHDGNDRSERMESSSGSSSASSGDGERRKCVGTLFAHYIKHSHTKDGKEQIIAKGPSCYGVSWKVSEFAPRRR